MMNILGRPNVDCLIPTFFQDIPLPLLLYGLTILHSMNLGRAHEF